MTCSTFYPTIKKLGFFHRAHKNVIYIKYEIFESIFTSWRVVVAKYLQI